MTVYLSKYNKNVTLQSFAPYQYALQFSLEKSKNSNNNFIEPDMKMASKLKGHQLTAVDENTSKKRKTKENVDEPSDISLEIVFQGFKAPPIYTENQNFKDLPDFLVKFGARISKLNYTDDLGDVDEKSRQLILKHCPNINEVKFKFTEYPDHVDDDESQRLVKFLAALAPRLTRLETINNLIGLHYLSCMGFIYENFSDKIKFVKTDELKEEELSVLSGDNNKNNPALSLEELIYCDNDFLYSKKRNNRSAESLALKSASLTDLVKLSNLRRIDLPFFLSKDKIPLVTTPLPLLNYASIRLLSNKRGKVATTSFIENIGIALANVTELKLCHLDPGLLVLNSTLKSCTKLDKLDLSDYNVSDDYNMGLAKLAGIKPKFKQLDATVNSDYSHEIDLILYLIDNVSSLATINIDGINKDEFMDKLISAGISSAGKVQHNVVLNLNGRCSRREELPTNEPKNLKVIVNSSG